MAHAMPPCYSGQRLVVGLFLEFLRAQDERGGNPPRDANVWPQERKSSDGGDEKGSEQNEIWLHEAEVPVDDAANERREKPDPQGVLHEQDGTAEI